MSKAAANPKVSVVVTTYNRAALLPRAIRSVLAQTYEDYELIIVDDCSTDDTPDVIRTFVDSRIRVVRHAENTGQSAAINTGIRLARGEYIAFLDDDDEWVESKLLRQVRALDESDPRVGLVYTWFDHRRCAQRRSARRWTQRHDGGPVGRPATVSSARTHFDVPGSDEGRTRNRRVRRGSKEPH